MAESLTQKPHERYLEEAARIAPNGAPEWLKSLRAQGAALFRETEFPHSRMEEWRQTNISDLVKTVFRAATPDSAGRVASNTVAEHLFGEAGWVELVFVDGFYSPEHSRVAALPQGVNAGSLYAAAKGADAATVEQHLGKYLGGRSAFTALNSAFVADGAYLHVPKNVALETPVHFLFLSTATEAERAQHVRNLFVLEQSSEATVVVTYAGLGDARYLTNAVEEVALGANAQLTHYKMVSEGCAGAHLATSEVRHGRDSRLTSFAFSLSGQVVRNQLLTHLAEEGAECALHGLYLNDEKRLVDNYLSITHEAPNCRSRIAYKGVLGGESNTVFAGKVYVHPEAQKTDSDQLSQNLLLTDAATVDTKPQLEIYADDVKCTHGATVGSPPQEVIFYFRSRGIGEAMARGMLTYGFADEIVSEVALEPLRERLERLVYEKYSPKF